MDQIESRLADLRPAPIILICQMGTRARPREGVERAVHYCLIHSTLLHPPRIAIEIKEPATATP